MDYITTDHHAELNAADKMRSWGYIDAVATTSGADGAINVRSSTALAQVKWRGGAAGRPDLNRLFGARVTTPRRHSSSSLPYLQQAVEYLDSVGIAVFIYDPVGEIEPANQVARRFIKRMTGERR